MLWLLRHAEAAQGQPDETRPLTKRGHDQATTVGVALARLHVPLDTCLASPKRRTMQTAQQVCISLGVGVTAEPMLAGDDYDAERLAVGLGETLIVGHNPTISAQVHELSGARVHLPTGGLAAIEHGQLMLLLAPEQMSAIVVGQESSGG